MMPATAVQSPQSFSPAPLQVADQPNAAQFVDQPYQRSAPLFLKTKLPGQQAPTIQEPAAEAPSKTSFADESPLPGFPPPGFPFPGAQFPGAQFPGVQFVPIPAGEFPMPQYPGRSFPGGIPHPGETAGEEEDRPSVKIQVQTSKSNIPLLNKKKLKKKKKL